MLMTLNMTQIPARFYGLWIAVADDEATVLAHGKTAEEALTKARKKGHDTLIVTHVRKPEVPNAELIAAIREGEREEKAGTLTYYDNADDFLASLD
jgi:DNA-binding NarL/FixJ family response regulator